MLKFNTLLICCTFLIHGTVMAQTSAVDVTAGNLSSQVQALVHLGDKLVTETRFEAATQTLDEAYNLLGEISDEAVVRSVLNSLANLYYSTGEMALAERYYRELLSYDENSGDALSLSVTLYNLGHTAAPQQRFREADAFFTHALNLNLELRDETGRAYTLKALGVNAHAREDLGEARTLLKASAELFGSIGDAVQQAAARRNLADVELAAGLPQTAVNYYLEALPVLAQNGFNSALLRCYRGLSQAFEQLRQFDKALIAQRAYTELMQAGLEQQNMNSTQRIREELDTRRYADANAALEKTGALQQRELAQSRSLVRMQFLVLVLAAALVLLVWVMFRRSEKTAKHMQKLASTDELTRLHNRRAILEKGKQEWLRAVRYKSPLSCLIFDLDHFKSINDSYGHGKGDEVLRAMAHQLIVTLRQSDCVGRIGGEEFLLFAPETDAGQAQMLAEKIRVGITNCRIPGMEGKKITISIGIATLSGETSLEQLIQHADEALYQVKRNGRNRSFVYMQELPGFKLGPALHAIMQRA